tara:strand:+ start:326 stop:703 length:378 start_codon:yes stop_codon:yes gene_type:complete
MAVLKYSLLLLSLIPVYSQAITSKEIVIENKLSSCINIKASEIFYVDGMPILEVSNQIIKPSSECGCRSLISEYSSNLVMDGYESRLLTAKLIFEGEKSKFPLATSNKIIGDYSVLIKISCALPD